MSWQTDRYKRREEPASVAPETPVAPTEGRSFGFQSGAGRGGEAAAARAPELTGAGAALGEPTSFRGGAGAPMPVEVVRGFRTTYTNPAPDSPGGGYSPTPARNTQEFASPLQAQQAFNRGARSEAVAAGDARGFTTPEATLDAQYGGFRPLGQTAAETVGEQARLTRTADAKGPLYDSQSALVNQQLADLKQKAEDDLKKKNVSAYQKLYVDEYGPAPKEGDKAYPHYYGGLTHAADNGPESGLGHVQQSKQFAKNEPLFTPENVAAYKKWTPEQATGFLTDLKERPGAYRQWGIEHGTPIQKMIGSQPPKPSVWNRLWQGD